MESLLIEIIAQQNQKLNKIVNNVDVEANEQTHEVILAHL